jgi:D-tyrosyl-tRNA(Tyr) deacylase
VRAILQRATAGEVSVDGELIGRLDPAPGLVILLGVGPEDGEAEGRLLAEKIAGLRIFADAEGKMNLSLLEMGGGALVISQFTLYADLRPGYTGAASPEVASPLVERVMEELRRLGAPVQGGRFGAHMQVRLTNDGPVTISLDTDMWR